MLIPCPSHSLSLRRLQVFEHGARILDGSFMTQDLSFGGLINTETGRFESSIMMHVSSADPYVLVIRMADESSRILVEDPSIYGFCKHPICLSELKEKVSCLYTVIMIKGPEPWLQKTITDAWLSTGISEVLMVEQVFRVTYTVICYEDCALEIFGVGVGGRPIGKLASYADLGSSAVDPCVKNESFNYSNGRGCVQVEASAQVIGPEV